MRVVLSNASTSWGGVRQVTEDLARGLLARGHEVVVFCRPGSRLAARMRPIAHCEEILRGTDFHPLTLARCVRALRRHRPDVVLALMTTPIRGGSAPIERTRTCGSTPTRARVRSRSPPGSTLATGAWK